MKINNILRERAEAAKRQLEEVFSAFVIVGLPIDKKQEPVIVSSGDAGVVRDMVTIANKKKA